jgi:hypothetical protein
MKKVALLVLFVTVLSLSMAVASTTTLPPQGETRLVTSAADSGPGTLRQALLDLQNGDTITFDPTTFPPSAPVTISISSELPHIHESNVTIDGSNAGVILDCTHVPGEWVGGLQVVESDGNRIRGLQVSNASGPGIAISGDARHNVIGGDRSAGTGPFGQGNLLSQNAVGIDLSTSGTTLNTITGNLVGTDAAGADTLGNSGSGVIISEGAHENTIGPDNVIAHNGGGGVVVQHQGSEHNTITQNSIHDNGSAGITLGAGGNADLAGPILFDFDLGAGTLVGATCSHCTVEVFSDSSDEGADYQGRTTADGTGYFAFDKGVPLTGPHLTATTTDVDGNTSGFSLPTTGTVGSLILQQGNDLPITQFLPRQSGELVDNRIGAQFDSYGYPEFYDFEIYPRGVKRARTAISGLEPELVDWDKPEDSVHPDHDAVFTRMADNGLTITYVLLFWDKATYPGGEGAPCARFKTEGEIENYLEFVRFIVRHFKDRVQYFEMWNEPDIQGYCPKWIEVTDYVNLVERTVPVIREEYPEAKIVVGGVSNTRFANAYDYLFDVLESDIMPLVDVVAWHPMYGTSPAYELYREYYYEYPSFVQEIKGVASAHGFAGEYQADEIGWATPETAVPDQPWVYSPMVAAKYHGRGILMHLGMDIGVGAPDDNIVVRNLCTAMAGAAPAPVPVQIQGTVTNTVTYTFSLPDGDHLVAFWTDGVAVEHDPGLPVTLTLPGYSDHRVMGVDVLHGFEQEVVAGEEDGNLVVRELLAKDYPILLRLISPKRVCLPIVLKGHPR